MSTGLEVYAPNGALITDADTRTLKLLGTLTIGANDALTGTVYNEALSFGAPFFIIKNDSFSYFYYICNAAMIDATTFRWTVTKTAYAAQAAGVVRSPFVIIYGIR